MNSSTIYKEVLLDHYRNPRNYGDVTQSEIIHRGSNPRCGDDLKIGVDFKSDVLSKVVFQGRGCSVCMASASMMTEAISGYSKSDVVELISNIKTWYDEPEGNNSAPIESLIALDAVRKYPARRRCVLLAWDALQTIVQEN